MNPSTSDVGRRTFRLPPEYQRSIPAGPVFTHVNQTVERGQLHTICESGKCPNRGECFSRGTLAFMILGDTCTRHCGFCAVKAGNPGGLIDWEEPTRLAEAVAALGLKHAVITAVARDDLKDGGAAVFAACIRAVRAKSPSTIIEVLTSDFNGVLNDVDAVLAARPDIFNHNIETVERLTPKVRSKATYRRSLEVLRHAADWSANLPPSPHPLPRRGEGVSNAVPSPFCGEGDDAGASSGEGGHARIKSGLMLGLGETKDEIRQALDDLRAAGVEYLTIGQYLQPSARHLSIRQFVPLDDFRFWSRTAHEMGFSRVASGPLVRSSYFADALHEGGSQHR